MSAARGLLIYVLGSVVTACAPTPRNVPCSNDAQCAQASEDYAYCLESRCVECVGSASCGESGTCVNGICEKACKVDGDCPARHLCADQVCAPF